VEVPAGILGTGRLKEEKALLKINFIMGVYRLLPGYGKVPYGLKLCGMGAGT